MPRHYINRHCINIDNVSHALTQHKHAKTLHSNYIDRHYIKIAHVSKIYWHNINMARHYVYKTVNCNTTHKKCDTEIYQELISACL